MTDAPTTNRRWFLQAGTLGVLGLTLDGYLRGRAHAATPTAGPARRAVFVFLQGGPSHHDTFDPKPDASAAVRGEFGTIATTIPGIRFADAVPLLAARTNHLAVLR